LEVTNMKKSTKATAVVAGKKRKKRFSDWQDAVHYYAGRVQCLADIGLTPARAHALAQHSYPCTSMYGTIADLRGVTRMISSVPEVRISTRDFYAPGNVFVVMKDEKDGLEKAFGIGAIEEDGRFLDTVQFCEREYEEGAA
jgi:hypothetical protein